MESFEQTVSADNLSSGGGGSGGGGGPDGGAALTESGGRENLSMGRAAESVAASVLSHVLPPPGGVDAHLGLESPNDNDTLSPLLEVVDNLEMELRGSNLNSSRHLGGISLPNDKFDNKSNSE